MVKSYLSAIFVSPVDHFVPAQTGTATQAWRNADQLPGTASDQKVASDSIQSIQSMQLWRSGSWEAGSATRLRIVEEGVVIGLMGYFCFGMACVLGLV